MSETVEYIDYNEEEILEDFKGILTEKLSKNTVDYFEKIINRKATPEEIKVIGEMFIERMDEFSDKIEKDSIIYDFVSDLEFDMDDLRDSIEVESELMDELEEVELQEEGEVKTNTFGLPKVESDEVDWNEAE